MKVSWWWLPLVAAYFFLAGVAFTHSWDWLSFEDSSLIWDDGWLVGIARIVIGLSPAFAIGIVFANLLGSTIEDAVRVKPYIRPTQAILGGDEEE